MNIKKLALLAVVGLALSAGSVYAGIQVQYTGPRLANEDPCDHFTGSWKGDGHISAHYLLSCHYTGVSEVTSQGGANYTVHVNLKADSGWLCKNVDQSLPAVCHNGNISIANDDVQLNGTTDGNSASFRNGKIKVSGINADIDYINLTR